MNYKCLKIINKFQLPTFRPAIVHNVQVIVHNVQISHIDRNIYIFEELKCWKMVEKPNVERLNLVTSDQYIKWFWLILSTLGYQVVTESKPIRFTFPYVAYYLPQCCNNFIFEIFLKKEGTILSPWHHTQHHKPCHAENWWEF